MTKMLEDLAEVVRLFDKLPKDGKVSATMYADAAKAQIAASNFFTAHHATITDMAKRLEAAERDAAVKFPSVELIYATVREHGYTTHRQAGEIAEAIHRMFCAAMQESCE